jgi:uncharacterized protein YecE (DUF72 family)
VAGHCFIGCAGWSLPRDAQPAFPAGGSHLERYAQRFGATEVNSSFHRPHREFVWERWARSVPGPFRFCAKLPKAITHEKRLAGVEAELDAFLAQARPLGEKLACLLVQLPPSFAFDPLRARAFLHSLRARWPRDVALEPRHVSWFGPEADALLAAHRVARVLADPVRFAQAAAPGGWASLVYLRLHGSPRMYYSPYAPGTIAALARRIAVELDAGRTVWCIFDNTASGAAVHDALALQAALDGLT